MTAIPQTADDRPSYPSTFDDRADELFTELDETSDPQRRTELCDEIITLAVPLADRLASRYRGRGVPTDDLQQVARAALVQAMRRFEGGGEQAFLGYVIPSIRGELKRHFRDHAWGIRPPRRIQEARLAVNKAHDELQASLGREPTVEELADATNIEVDTVREVWVARRLCWPDSLDRPLGEESGTATAADAIGAEDPQLDRIHDRLILSPLLDRLDPRERKVVFLRYYRGRSQREVGQRIGVTQMQVSRIEAKIMRELREALGLEQPDAA
jgi:RNA polymerase sigma-B factor